MNFSNKFRNIMALFLVVLGVISLLSFTSFIKNVKYKCMIQMVNYQGEKAYVAISLIDPNGKYEKTLYVQGDDEDWFRDVKAWWSFSEGINESLDGITGATIGNGERKITFLEIEASKIDAGYKVKFESAVENQKYYETDAIVDLNTATIKNKVNGKGYIRYIRMIPNERN